MLYFIWLHSMCKHNGTDSFSHILFMCLQYRKHILILQCFNSYTKCNFQVWPVRFYSHVSRKHLPSCILVQHPKTLLQKSRPLIYLSLCTLNQKLSNVFIVKMVYEHVIGHTYTRTTRKNNFGKW